MLRRLFGVVVAALLCFGTAAHAQDVLPVPALTERVIDQTGTLTAEQKAALEVARGLNAGAKK